MKVIKKFEPLPQLLRLSSKNMATLVFVNFSLFLDRVILAQWSSEALNASVSATAIASIFIFGAIAIGSISEVFFAKAHASGRKKEIGPILWQMIWFSIIMAILFWVIVYFFSAVLIPSSTSSKLAQTYFSWQLSFGFLPIIIAILNAFFIGTQRFGWVFLAAVAVGFVKILCSWPLVLGIDGLFMGMGVKGALISSAVSYLLHIFILFFLIKKTGKLSKYGLQNFYFNPKLFSQMVMLGLPQALGVMLNYAAWGLAVTFIAGAGEKHLMMYTVIDSFYVLFGFTTEGLQKGVLSMSSFALGAGRRNYLVPISKSAYIILFFIISALAIPFLVFPQILSSILHINQLSSSEFSLACLIVWIYLSLDGISWILHGLLTSLGDTCFTNPINGLSSLIFGAGASYISTQVFSCEYYLTCWISILYGTINVLLLSARFRSWRLDEPKKAKAQITQNNAYFSCSI